MMGNVTSADNEANLATEHADMVSLIFVMQC